MNNHNTNEEVWKDISDYEGYYQISNFGNVYSVRYNIMRKQRLNKGYSEVKLSVDKKEKVFKVHRLVALHFIPNIENKKEVNHKDENPLNNHVSNLMWCTPKENSNWGTRGERLSKANKLRFVRPLSLNQSPNIKLKKY